MRQGPLRHKWFAAFTGAIAAAAILRVVQSAPYPLWRACRSTHRPGGQAPAPHRLRRRGDRAHGGHSLSAIGGVFSIELLYGIGFLLGSAEVLWGVTTDFSVLPSLVEEHELTDANAIFLAADRAARIVGPTLGSFAIAERQRDVDRGVASGKGRHARAALLKWAP